MVKGMKKMNKYLAKGKLTNMLCAGLIIAVSISMSACGLTVKHVESSGTETASVQIPNPLLYHKTIDEASKVIGFTFIIPAKIPEGYVQDEIVTINKEIAQVNYKSGENIITFRTAKGVSDISGDYTDYPSIRTITVGDLSVTAKSEGSGVHVAYWTKGDFSYSILFSVDVSDDQLAEIINSI
jgi:hypothetical protein